ncbi:MAG: RNA-binding domain-containing protein [Saprospiraceae bacterium]
MPSIIIETALNTCPDFSDFAPEEKQEIGQICRVVEYEAGHSVFSLEHQERYIFIVVFGHLSLRLRNNKRGEFTKGSLFGEITLFSEAGRMGAIHCNARSTLVAIDKYGILDPKQGLSTELRLKLVLMLGQKVAGYLYKDSSIPTLELVKKPEGLGLEFKESLAVQPKIEETIVAFMNAQGGTILVGVRNDGKLIGVYQNNNDIDQIMLGMVNKIKSKTNQVAATYFEHDVEAIEGKKILRITVDPSLNPTLLHFQKQNSTIERFIVRCDAQNTELKTATEIIEYTRKRFLTYAN